MYITSGSVQAGNTVSFRLWVYDQGGTLTDPDELSIRIVRGKEVVESGFIDEIARIEPGKYRFDLNESTDEKGTFKAVWRAKVTDGDDVLWLVEQDSIEAK